MIIMDETVVENVDSDGNHLGVVLIVWQAVPFTVAFQSSSSWK